jgi:hypothetical protein
MTMQRLLTRFGLAAAIGALITSTAAAQEQATVLKRDGSRVTGRFEALNRNTNTLYVRVSLGDQRLVPLAEAAMLEVGGGADNLPAGELDAARSGDHVLVLRAGDVMRGRLLNIEGGEGSGQEPEPRVVSFKPNDAAERRVRFSEVRRLYFGNFPESLIPRSATPAPTAPESPVPAGAVRVPANAGWVSTNVTLTRRDRVQFTAEGQVQLSGDGEDKAGPAGSLRGRYAASAPAPSLLAGALIGRIGNGPPFAIGDQTQPLPMPGDGVLFLAVNDDHASDNQGAFVVSMRVTRGRR